MELNLAFRKFNQNENLFKEDNTVAHNINVNCEFGFSRCK